MQERCIVTMTNSWSARLIHDMNGYIVSIREINVGGTRGVPMPHAGFGFSNEWDDDTQRNYHIR